MKGLELSEKYYLEFAKDKLAEIMGDVPYAAGLAGEGSQCMGYDDELSQDHDFAPGFCIWVGDEVAADSDLMGKLQAFYRSLPAEFLGFSNRNVIADDRLGVIPMGQFFANFTGTLGTTDLPGLPTNNIEWLFASESSLACAVNGKVFVDNDGRFTKVRQILSKGYPEDVLRKKIAARAAILSQAGQYNLLRILKRGDKVAALSALSRFTDAAISMSHLLNGKYKPFYKWAPTSLAELDKLKDINALILQLPEIMEPLAGSGDFDAAYKRAFDLTEGICEGFSTALFDMGFTRRKDPFLQNLLGDIMSGIKDPQLRRMPPMVDCPND